MTPETAPDSILDLLSESFPPEQVGLANPLFGTTSTEAAALHALWGKDAAQDFYSGLVRRGVQVLDGNSVVRDRVASGQLAWGLTDTDDACGAIQRGAPVQVIFPDQNGFGSLLIPNTVALIAGGPHPAEGQALADFLLSARTEAQLVELDWIAFPTHELPEGVAPDCYAGVQVQGMAVGFEEIFAALAPSQAALKALFVQ
ncbi:MAG: putative 2-aminoethylphosphonate-binding periplasmic protein precursor [Chloroflexi bacterium ADurb.Bin222]|nr:MAG: putative 2-aminoethylphosphonate-binding periplasmic protein precursor [Chloroflexi bacterium ADurb.Bin222]